MKWIKLPDGEREQSRYQSEDGRFTLTGPDWKKNDGFGNEWELTDAARFMIDRRTRFDYTAIVQATHTNATRRDAISRAERTMTDEAAGTVEARWAGFASREDAQAYIDADRAEQRERQRQRKARDRRDARSLRLASESPAIREAARVKAEVLNAKAAAARRESHRYEAAAQRLTRLATT